MSCLIFFFHFCLFLKSKYVFKHIFGFPLLNPVIKLLIAFIFMKNNHLLSSNLIAF